MLLIVHRAVEHLASHLGASPDELKLVISLLLSYPFSGLLKRIPDSRIALKNVFSICVSMFYLVGLFDLWGGVQTLAISSAATYCIAKYLRHSPYMPWIGFFFLMTHMSVSQLVRQFSDSPGAIDVTGAQMVLVIKLSAFCWNVADGTLPDELLSEFQRDRRLVELPGLLEFAGYVLFFPALLAGPAFDFAEYRRWLDTSMFDVPAGVHPSKWPPSRKKRRIPRSGTPAAWKAGAGLFWVGLFLLLGRRFSPAVLTSHSYTEYGLPSRIWLMYMASFTARLKYYGVWTLTEGACILTGLGYRGVDPVTGKVSWDRLRNVNPWLVETAQNSRGFLEGWNINTNNWLRNYVYLRVTPRGRKPGFRASLATFTCSAVWHGFYPGYYLTFVLGSLVQTVAKKFRRNVRPFFIDPISGQPSRNKPYYDVISWFATQLTFGFMTTPFLVLSFSSSLQVWSRVYFYGFAWTLASLAFFASPAKRQMQAKQEARQSKAGAKLVRTHSQESVSGRAPVLGLSVDPERDIAEAVEEFKAEMDKQKKL